MRFTFILELENHSNCFLIETDCLSETRTKHQQVSPAYVERSIAIAITQVYLLDLYIYWLNLMLRLMIKFGLFVIIEANVNSSHLRV